MPEASVVYSEVNFARATGKAKETASSSAENTYSEIRIANTQPPTEVPGSQQPPASNRRAKAVLVLSALLAAALLALGCYLYVHFQNKGLGDKHEGGLDRYDGTWEEHGGKCYYFSNSTLSWNKSKHECRKMGGDLVKIDNKEEQEFLAKRLEDKMDQPEDKFWIGLTDSKEEGKWLWVDESLLKESLTFWNPKEPDNWTGEDSDGEDCVRMGEKGGATDRKIWFDKSCKTPHKCICEKQKQDSVKTCV